MKIVDIKTTAVTVPMEAPLRWSLGIETGTTRTILEIITDEGIVGLGETYGGEATLAALQFVRKVSGFRQPSTRHVDAFDSAVDDVQAVCKRLLESITANTVHARS